MIGRRCNMASYILLLLGLVRSLSADSHHTPLETMADVTNDFGVCVLQIIASPNTNTVFSPYGLVSMALLVYEGATGQTAAEIYNTLHLPWHRDIVRIGFRDLHRYLRSYFSSEGFLKGLVLSKPNVPLRPSYIEVLKFYGFQPDTSITQPVLTTQASISNREKENNDTLLTTNIPETTPQPQTTLTINTQEMTTIPIMTTMSTMKETDSTQLSEKEPATTLSTRTTQMETTTNIITFTDKKPTNPEVLAMQGPTAEATTTPTTVTTSKSRETTILPTNGGETTIIVTLTTESAESIKTTMEQTNILLSKTTKEMSTTTEEIKTTVNNSITTTDNQTFPTTIYMMLNKETADQETTLLTTQTEVQTEPTTTEMNVITLTNEVPPKLESMNMILNRINITEKNQTKLPVSTFPPTEDRMENYSTNEQVDTTVSEFVSVIPNEISTKEIFTEEAVTDDITDSTVFIDPTLSLEDLLFFTTPGDVEIMTDKGTTMLGAFILMEEDKSQMNLPEFTTNEINEKNKRSTQNVNESTKPPNIEYTIPLNNLYSSFIKSNDSQIAVQLNPEYQTESSEFSSMESSSHSTNKQSTHSSFSEFPHEMLEHTKGYLDIQSTEYLETNTEENDIEEDVSGFPTLEPDTIIFPTNKSPRLQRSVKSDERPAQLGNWVGPASGWRPNPTEQWFWTYSGDKLVPVLTYTAYLPYAELPLLRATAIQLPLDDPRYTLMILLPKNSRGLKQMLYSLQWHSLRDILKLFKPTPVYAVVPTFTIIKHINLTPALHKLGVRNMFDAYLANLSEMSAEPNLYVRSVEQVITMSVQKYYTNHKLLEASSSQVDQHFLATHPFAYFVMDIETKVALVAGTIMDPSLRNS